MNSSGFNSGIDENEIEFKLDLNNQKYGLQSHRSNTDNTYTFKSENFPRLLINYFEQFHQSGKFSDIVLKPSRGSPHQLKAHKVILCAASPYFRGLFSGSFIENDSCTELYFDTIPFETLKQIIEFFYSTEIRINESNVQALLPAAQLLQCDDIVNACCLFLFYNMNSSNCIGIKEFASLYGCVDLMKAAHTYLLINCLEVLEGEEFLNLDFEKAVKILKSENLNIKDESDLFNAACNWTRYDLTVRRFLLKKIFSSINLHLCSPKFLKEQMENNKLFKMGDCEKTRENVAQIIDKLISHQPMCSSLPTRRAWCTMYLIGGYQGESLKLNETYNLKTNTWSKRAELEIGRSGIACIMYAFFNYVIGGRLNYSNKKVDCADVVAFDPFNNVWKNCCPMNVPRNRAAAGVIDDRIYVAGGANGSNCLNSVESFYEKENIWTFVSPMFSARVGHNCVVVNRLLYSIGGFDGYDRLNSVEVYNPDTDKWTQVEPMKTKRSGAGACAIGNEIYVVGGYDGKNQLNSCEKYDTVTNKWEFISPIKTNRSAIGCCSYKNYIMITGGYDGTNFLSSSEIYDTKTLEWEENENLNLSVERSGHGVVGNVGFT